MYRIKRFIDWFRYNLPRGIKNLIIWFPIVWKDRSWDHHFIYTSLHHKLKLTEKAIRNGHHVDCEKDADKIKTCALLLDRLIKDDYLENALKKHDEKWGKGEMKTTKCDDGMYKFNIIYENVKTKDDDQQQRKDFRAAVKHEGYLKQQDLDLLFKIMRKNIQSWWD